MNTLLSLVRDIYDAAGDPCGWQGVLTRLAGTLESPHGMLWTQRLNAPPTDFTVLGVVGYDPAFFASYQEHYGSRNVYLQRGRCQLSPGAVRFDGELCPRPAALRTEFFNDWIKPQRIGEAAVFAAVLQEQGTVGMLCMAHDEHAQYEEADRQFLTLLVPHLQQGLRLHQRITGLESQKDAAERALDSWSVGVVVLDASGSVLLANRRARAMFDQRPGTGCGRWCLGRSLSAVGYAASPFQRCDV